jgi:hypothetical protein
MTNNTLFVSTVFNSPFDIEVFYNGISEFSLYEKLKLEDPKDIKNYDLKDILALKNEIAILEYYMTLGFSYIKDPDSPQESYPIKNHIDLINKNISDKIVKV